MNKKIVLATITILASLVLGLTVYSIILNNHVLYLQGSAALGTGVTSGNAKPPYEVHATTTFYKDGKIIQQQYHAGAVVNQGLNLTCAKLLGLAASYNITTYIMNLTYVSIGNAGTLNTGITVLPGEWNRTSATPHDATYNSFNLTATFYPDSGPYTADCIGVNYQTGIGNHALFCYDTFSEVTGIDDTFTIVVEFKITVASA
jgi:hypothetical protein